MNIVICAPHHWQIPSPPHTGVIVVLDLAIALRSLGHDVQMIAPYGTDFDRVLDMPCANGTGEPSAEECEAQALKWHMGALRRADVIHDWSDKKSFAQTFPEKSVSTLLSGNFDHPAHGRNVVVWSEEMKGRALRGACDYEGTEFTQWMSTSQPVTDVRIAHGGIDTDFYCPGDAPKEDFVLWLGRFHPARGYRLAIEAAKLTALNWVMAGEHPADATNDHQRECALEAQRLAADVSNIRIEWLPRDPHHHTAKRELYRKARAYVFDPLFQEPFGLSQVEALACGTPVAATNFGSTLEVLGDCAWFADARYKPEGAASSLAATTIVARDLSPEQCRARAVEKFDRKVMAARYVELYKECLAGGWGGR
jgi:glycosyltransferase involved in cell wall biosynthesis